MAYTTINKSTDYFNTKLYTGTGSSLVLTGVGHQPDMVWLKVRSTTSSHRITDVVRGTGQVIYPNDTAEQSAESSVTAFGTDGFTVGTEGGTNTNGATYVGWSWKAGGGQGSSNTDGSINTTYTSVNTTSGFSISKYTGTGSNATIGHGLGVAPKVVMIKDLSVGKDWAVYHESIGNTKYLELNTTDAVGTASNAWNNTSPTSSVVSIGSRDTLNTSSNNYIAYCFAEKTGFSKFGQYTGNGNADGTFVYTGFKPAFLLSKMSSGTQGWFLVDNKRANPYNPIDGSLHPNSNAAEDTASDFFVDFTSNGFKLRDNDAQLNGSGSTYIYMAFAEAPLVGSNNVPATAR